MQKTIIYRNKKGNLATKRFINPYISLGFLLLITLTTFFLLIATTCINNINKSYEIRSLRQNHVVVQYNHAHISLQ